jgi:hypothetical protein
MKTRLEKHDGRLTLKVYYDPALCNRDEAIAAGLASFGLKHGQAAVLAFPFPPQLGRELCFLQEKYRKRGGWLSF